MSRSVLDRQTLAKFLPSPEAIRAFEGLLKDIGGFPSTIEEANALAGQALTVANGALTTLAIVAEALVQLEGAPAPLPQVDLDDTAPRAHLGTMSSQNADRVEITGGTTGLDGGAVGAPSLYLGSDRTTGLYRSDSNAWAIAIAGVKLVDLMAQVLKVTGKIIVTDQIISTAPVGTPPLQVDSATKVANLYVDRAALADNSETANALNSPSTLPDAATDLPTVINLANALRAAAIAKGL